jgi:hypothetical protein
MRLLWLIPAVLCLALASLQFRKRNKYHEAIVSITERLTPKLSTGLRESRYAGLWNTYGVSLVLALMGAGFAVAALAN